MLRVRVYVSYLVKISKDWSGDCNLLKKVGSTELS